MQSKRGEALFLNGVQEYVLEEIVAVQEHLPEQILFLQPHSGSKILHLSQTPPTIDAPMQLYISIGKNRRDVAYMAEIVGWEYKPGMDNERRKLVSRIQAVFQPVETGMVFDPNQANLIHVRRMSKLKEPFSVAKLIKTSDGKPLSENRSRSGGPSYVRPLPED